MNSHTLSPKSKIGEIKRCSVCGESGHNRLQHEQPSTKICSVCKKELPRKEFRKVNSKARKMPIWTTVCKKCDIARSAAYYRRDFPTRLNLLLTSIRARCRNRGIEFTIDLPFLESLYAKQQGYCFYSGLELSLQTGDYAVSIDRKDPDMGYTPSNCVLTCWLVNNMKRCLQEHIFIKICQAIGNHRDLKVSKAS